MQTTIEPTLADGLAVPMVGYNAFLTARPLIDKMVVVKEEWIALAILRLVEQEKSKHLQLIFKLKLHSVYWRPVNVFLIHLQLWWKVLVRPDWQLYWLAI